MNRALLVASITVAIVFVGAAFLKGYARGTSNDPTVSTRNGAPRGLLALRLLLAARDVPTEVIASFDANVPGPAGAHTFVIPPPERSAWTAEDVAALRAHVDAGDDAVILCDDEPARNARLDALLESFGVECVRADIPLGESVQTTAAATLDGDARSLTVLGPGRVRVKTGQPMFPTFLAASDAVVVKGPLGAGVVTVVGSASAVANDGLAQGDNALFALKALRGNGRSVIIDERHHASRSRAAVFQSAMSGAGPLTGLLALVLLVPLSLLSLAPRPGDPPRDDDARTGAPAAEAQARALAALLVQAKDSRSPRSR